MSKATSSNVVHGPPQDQVFINFRGKEVRGNFASHLESALEREGINVFSDNHERMGKGLEIFYKRIEESKIAIAVISSLYTESKWCLNELVKIRECVKKKTLEVFPVFYKVNVDTVKRRKAEFGQNFDRLVKKDLTKFKPWRKALRFVTEIKGQVVDENSDEVQIIKKIVKDVMIKLEESRTDQGTMSPRGNIIGLAKEKIEGEPESSSSSNASPVFGIKTRQQQLEEKLDFESKEVTRFVGVVGMPGIGKTTLAKKLLEDWGSEFLHTMFLDDVREKSKSLGFHRLHEDLLYGLERSKHDGQEKKDIECPLVSLKAELSESKVFIVLDDVSEKSQIDMILGGREWLREGSRVVITTSRKSVIKEMVDETYLVPGLSDEDGFKYFEKHAFSVACEPSFKNLAEQFVDYSRGHPLVLKVLGRELLRKDKAYWESKLGALAKSPISNTIQNVLRIPYDDLGKHHKNLFLDVAFFFRFEDEYHVRSLLDSSVDENASEIKDLEDRFLINICGGRVEVNDLMYTLAMGLESSSEYSTSGRRLFNHGEIISILRNKPEATKVRGIFLDMSEVPRKMSLGSDTFKDMNDLRYLKFFNSSFPKDNEAKCNLIFPNGLKFTLQEIRYLHWLKFPLKILPQDFNPKNLIDLKLPYSHIEQLWDREKDISKLMWLDLNHSSKLRTLSGLWRARKLKSINLEGCTELKTVHEELKNMESLVFLNMRGCTSLKSLPQMNLISLKTLILSGCSNLEEFNLISENLEELYLDGTAIKRLPSTIGKLKRLVLLILKDCKRLMSLPDSIGNLKALQKLVLSGCKSFTAFPKVKEEMKQLKTLLLDGTAIKEMPHLLSRFSDQGQTSSWSHCNLREGPHEIYRLSTVQRLCLSRNNLRSLPNNIRYLFNLKWLDLKYCEELISLPMLPPNLHWLDAHGCISLENIESPLALILAETEHSHSTFTFTNCTKLNQVVKNGIVSHFRRKIQLMSDALAHQEKGSKIDALIGVCYPSWQLPVWFNHRTLGSELTQKLPRHWNEDGLTGVAICAVVSFKNYQAQSKRLLVRCTSEFKEEDEPLIQFSCILGGWTEHGNDRPRDIIKSSGHVFIGYNSLLDIKKQDRGAGYVATEASFKFEVTDGTKHITNCEVLKCGFTLIYAATKPVHILCTEKNCDHGEIRSTSLKNNGGNIKSEESHFQIQSGATSVSMVVSEKGNEIIEKVNSFKATSNAPDTSGGSMSPSSSQGSEVVDDVSLQTDETNPGAETCYFESWEGTKKHGNDESAHNGPKHLCERMEKPIRLICLVISICAGSVFLLTKDKKKR
uniref:ADP-ribosyl cyclase/cyclic ADP-ribose hydrolase n=1 Tax=Noccaea caerulescens TaxID=107243 RepID=A0A1J3JNI6_NOCCA